MLYMVVASHGPENCPAVTEKVRKKALAMGPKMAEVSKAHNSEIRGGWISRAKHIGYVLIDAPSAHDVEETVWELELTHWNIVDINPLVTIEETMQHLSEL